MDQPPPGIDPSNIPLAPNPNGDPPNFNSPESLQTTVLATGIAFILVSGICVVLRLYTGLKKSRKLFADDYFCVAGEIVGIAQWAVQYTMMTHGLGRHSWDIPATALTLPVMKLQLASQMLAAGTHFAVKAALVLFFIRAFGTLRWVRITCYSVLLLTLLSYASYVVIVLIFCIPRSGEAWDHSIVDRCVTGAPSTIAVGVYSVVADLVLFIMPFPIIAGLTLSPQKKRAVEVVFLIGFLVVVTSVVGLAYRVIVLYNTNDPVWNGTNVSITAYTEVFGTVIVACAPALSSFWVNIFARSSLYSSFRSTFFRSWPGPTAATASYHYPAQQSGKSTQGPKRPHTGHSSSRDLVDKDFPLSSIQKSTIITQKVSNDNSSDLEHGRNNGRWELGNTPQGW